MPVNQKGNAGGPRLEAHWRTVSWAMLDKFLQLVFGLGFLLLVVRSLPTEEFGLQGLASATLLTASQLLRSLLLVPTIKYVAETRQPGRVAATGAWLYAGASTAIALLLWAGRSFWV